MNLDIRQYIVNNFKNSGISELQESIEDSIKKGDEVTLPGLGVFFEVLWNNSDDNTRQNIMSTIKNNLK